MPNNTGITREDIRDETIQDLQVAPDAAIQESKIAFDIVGGHRHDGTDSRLIPGGGGGGDTVVTDSAFAGAVDGVNATYTLAQNFQANSVAAYCQGLRQKRGIHFTEVPPNQVQFSTAPKTGQNLVFDCVAA